MRLTGIAAVLALGALACGKKADQGQLRFVLPTRLGHVELVGGIEPALFRRDLHL